MTLMWNEQAWAKGFQVHLVVTWKRALKYEKFPPCFSIIRPSFPPGPG